MCSEIKQLRRMSPQLLNVNANVNSRSCDPHSTCYIITVRNSIGLAYTLTGLGQE